MEHDLEYDVLIIGAGGGGWAGGILSAAADGMRCGEEICKLL